MIERLVGPVTMVAAVGCAVVGGLLFAFSTAVMPALARQPAASATATMQSINAVIQNPLFLLVFLGTAASCAGAGVLALVAGGRGAVLTAVCAAVFVVGTFGVTMVFHIPLNDKLASMDPTLPATQDFWRDYLARWTVGNHWRAGAAIVAATGLMWAARQVNGIAASTVVS